ncbi:hypothetical protein Gohar_006692 [Gossypium harknessii]|uniref:Uncharacterized protein n=1 Tax=Gossypium harknessii TaxID=34285 RepID=A0A7J9GEF8_9ROSI|nr:hypothetical protein [Gossypium harknessii]
MQKSRSTYGWMDKEMNPQKKFVGDDVNKQFVILQRKQKEERRKRGVQRGR